jgi:hydroxypyruvate isomerase
MKHSLDPLSQTSLSRRQMLGRGAALAAGAALLSRAPLIGAAEATAPIVTKGRTRQSIVPWCWQLFGEKWDLDRICQVARQLGLTSVELTTAEGFPTLKKYGLTSAIVQVDMNPDPPFLKGFNNPDFWAKVTKATEEAIDAAAAFGSSNVICFTGYSAKDPAKPDGAQISLEKGARSCVVGFKKIMAYAEKKKVTLCLEMLNSRDTSHPMKGHPGYQGDHTDYCIDIIKKVGSPRLKLLFDVYHVQIMDGDVIRRIHQFKDYIGHVHVAGCPGRGELDNKQEINFPPIMQALLDIGYKGYVGQEFIPTREPLQGLREAVTLCDV